ncbi:PIN domain-containing protein [uncultured Methanospirillum sp.]|uniref:PIN domain-containing protein n=1 Tax=uncultured Methanospirillum sp. TaxID=262503 RepID=UPI0029C6B992|nr:PIN domain-containing protein [uncultured Methanospirillum sp.]
MIPLLFDTHALLTFFNDENNSDIIGSYLEEVDDRARKGYISTITISELSYLYIRNDMKREGEACIHALLNTALEVVPVDVNIAISAGNLKKRKISLADAIIAATAIQVQATVVTNDTHFDELGVPRIEYL